MSFHVMGTWETERPSYIQSTVVMDNKMDLIKRKTDDKKMEDNSNDFGNEPLIIPPSYNAFQVNRLKPIKFGRVRPVIPK